VSEVAIGTSFARIHLVGGHSRVPDQEGQGAIQVPRRSPPVQIAIASGSGLAPWHAVLVARREEHEAEETR
jgi:hypothetical protein